MATLKYTNCNIVIESPNAVNEIWPNVFGQFTLGVVCWENIKEYVSGQFTIGEHGVVCWEEVRGNVSGQCTLGVVCWEDIAFTSSQFFICSFYSTNTTENVLRKKSNCKHF